MRFMPPTNAALCSNNNDDSTSGLHVCSTTHVTIKSTKNKLCLQCIMYNINKAPLVIPAMA